MPTRSEFRKLQNFINRAICKPVIPDVFIKLYTELNDVKDGDDWTEAYENVLKKLSKMDLCDLLRGIPKEAIWTAIEQKYDALADGQRQKQQALATKLNKEVQAEFRKEYQKFKIDEIARNESFRKRPADLIQNALEQLDDDDDIPVPKKMAKIEKELLHIMPPLPNNNNNNNNMAQIEAFQEDFVHNNTKVPDTVIDIEYCEY